MAEETPVSEAEVILVGLVASKSKPGPLWLPVVPDRWRNHKPRMRREFDNQLGWSARGRRLWVGAALVEAWHETGGDMALMPGATCEAAMRSLLGDAYRQREKGRLGAAIERALPYLVTVEDKDGDLVAVPRPDIAGPLWPRIESARPEITERGRRMREHLGDAAAEFAIEYRRTYRDTTARKEMADSLGTTPRALEGRFTRIIKRARRWEDSDAA